jgi:ComF family protein
LQNALRADSATEGHALEVAILTQIQAIAAGARRDIARRFARLFAQDCVLCGTASDDAIVCAACAADLLRLPAEVCPRCAQPTPRGETCGRCLAHPPAFDAAHAVYRYAFPLDRLIQSFKYGHRLALAPYFGSQLAALAASLATSPGISLTAERPVELIVPLPLHGDRLRQRGFNQALELARPVARALRVPIDATSCRRTRDTAAQADLAWRERIANVRNAFSCSADYSGRHVVLIDDVMTTGASLDECARTLKLHGAARVSALVLARALPKSTENPSAP